MSHYIGVDVGTTSARAGLFSKEGRLICAATHLIDVYKPKTDYYEHSSNNIWQAVINCIRKLLEDSKVAPDAVNGIGFDATCSLVVLGANDQPISVSPTGDPNHNVIVWMDHRAIKQADFINSTKHEVLKYVGGVISPEMETPKLLWLKQHKPESWNKATKFLDLVDYLTYAATGSDTRSLCTVVCKWTFQEHKRPQSGSGSDDTYGWDDSYFRQIGLEDLVEEKYSRIGISVGMMGQPIGNGLSAKAAQELGLKEGTAVSVGIIDAHAGGIGLLGTSISGEKIDLKILERRLAFIAGTSACHMACSIEPKFISGIWGPYMQAMIPNAWLTEGGQSAVGWLIDHVIDTHSEGKSLKDQAKQENCSVFDILNKQLTALAQQKSTSLQMLTSHLHVLPYWHGNRSPRADPTLQGMISGLTLGDTLAIVYFATLQAIALGTRHIISEMNKQGYNIDTIFMTGGFAKNILFVEELASITKCRVVLAQESDAVLLGSAILGAVASKEYDSILSAMSAMNKVGKIFEPSTDPRTISFYDAKYQVFLKMYEHQMEYRALMNQHSTEVDK